MFRKECCRRRSVCPSSCLKVWRVHGPGASHDRPPHYQPTHRSSFIISFADKHSQQHVYLSYVRLAACSLQTSFLYLSPDPETFRCYTHSRTNERGYVSME